MTKGDPVETISEYIAKTPITRAQKRLIIGCNINPVDGKYWGHAPFYQRSTNTETDKDGWHIYDRWGNAKFLGYSVDHAIELCT